MPARQICRSPDLCQTVEKLPAHRRLLRHPAERRVRLHRRSRTRPRQRGARRVRNSKRPQDRIDVPALTPSASTPRSARRSRRAVAGLPAENRSTRVKVEMSEPAGFAVGSLLEATPAAPRDEAEMTHNRPAPDTVLVRDAFDPIHTEIGHGSILIAAITSCTNTSNPSVMLAAGLVAKKANEKGLKVAPFVKSSLGPGSRVVTDYLEATGLQGELDQLGFQTVGYGCTTCIGNAGPLHPAIDGAIKEGDLVCASVLSGNRNFEARIHGSIKANFLMSPPLVVAYALAGRVDLDLTKDPLGTDQNGDPVFLADLWPTQQEVKDLLASALKPEVYEKLYGDFDSANPKWGEIPGKSGATYAWDDDSTYIQLPPFFEGYTGELGDIADITGARPLGIFGDSVTTDHISPAGAIKADSPAGKYLLDHGVEKASFNSFGSRRGNDRVMTRGTFGNVRIKNLMVPGTEGGYTTYFGGGDVPALDNPKSTESGTPTHIYDAAMAYKADGTPLVVIGGEDYGMGSSRDWAAKGTRLLGVQAVVTKSFERIHRSNLIGMGVLPLNFKNKEDYDKVAARHDATFSITGLSNDIKPRQEVTLKAEVPGGESVEVPVIVRLDTPVEIDYYRAGGILPYVLAQILRG
ncbi:MAG: aconitate hydratase AcnA [Verrucomicrobiales bacterium]